MKNRLGKPTKMQNGFTQELTGSMDQRLHKLSVVGPRGILISISFERRFSPQGLRVCWGA
jgi:hypothetical protein